jgi:hypothetical protein
MLHRLRIFRWPALAGTLLLAAAWVASHRGSIWIAPQIGSHIPILLFMGGIAQVRLDPLPSLPAALPPPIGFSATAPLGVFVFH